MSNDSTRIIRIEGARHEECVTDLLRQLLRGNYEAAEKHAAVPFVRSVLACGGRFTVPVLNLAAVLPNVESRKLIGLHIASYDGSRKDDDWYLKLLDQFFSAGVGGQPAGA